MRSLNLIFCCLYFIIATQAQTSKKTFAAGYKPANDGLSDKDKLARLFATKTDAKGNKLDPRQFGGHYILLNFYDRNADSARDAFSFKILYALQAKIQGLKVIRITRLPGKFHDVYQGWKQQADKDNFTITHVLDNEASEKFSATDAYNVNELPVTLLLDTNGRVVNTFIGYVSDSAKKVWSVVNKRLMSNDEAKDMNHIIEADNLLEEWSSASELNEKERVLSKLDNNNPYTPRLRANMYASLVEENISQKNSQVAQKWLAAIDDREIRVESSLLFAKHLQKAGSINEALKIIVDLMDDILSRGKNAKPDVDMINDYSKLAAMYCRLLAVEGNEQSIIQYLEPLYEACEFFPGDPHTVLANGLPGIDSLLTYQYAKALSVSTNSEKVAHVLASYINAHPQREVVKKEMLNRFSHVKNLSTHLDNIPCTGTELNRQNLFKLFLKKDIKGIVHGLNSIKSKYILIDFWGSWCGPCRASHPNLKEMYKKYKHKGLEIVGLAEEFNNNNQNVFQWKRAVAQDGITWIQYLNPERSDQFNAFLEFKQANNAHLVQKLILDREGNFIGVFEGKDKEGLNKKLAEIMH